MNRIQKYSFALVFAAVATLSFSSMAFAGDPADGPAADFGALPLNIGHVEVGGSATYTRNVQTNDRFLSIAPKAEYFFFNRFSAGGSLEYTDAADNNGAVTTRLLIGPSVTYYVTHTARTAVSLDQSILFTSVTNRDNVIQGATGLAFDYFFSPSLAFGPALRGIYYFNGGVNKPSDQVQLAFNFSMFL